MPGCGEPGRSSTLVPGDIVLLEAGGVVPADGRIVSSATLEVQEAALTGESAPVPKDPATLPAGDVALGDRTNLVFQNTQVTLGTAIVVVTGTGSATQMGQIAGMVTATKRSKSPLQRELDGMTKVFGTIAFAAVAVIAIFGLVRGMDTTTLVLLCISTAIASIPTGLPTFVEAMLSSGAWRLAEAKAVVKSLSDVETLGGTTVINSDKTGTLTMNAMTATQMLGGGDWFTIEGPRIPEDRRDPGRRRGNLPDFRNLALGLVLCTDAAVGDDGSVIGDPTEAAFVVLAAKMGVGAEETPETRPRRAEVPFDSEYKFMATFHDRPAWLARPDRPAAALHLREGRARRGAAALLAGAVARPDRPDRHRAGGDPDRQPQAVRARAARARVRREGHGRPGHDRSGGRPDGCRH
jgi:Ca2+-transporting ATPase